MKEKRKPIGKIVPLKDMIKDDVVLGDVLSIAHDNYLYVGIVTGFTDVSVRVTVLLPPPGNFTHDIFIRQRLFSRATLKISSTLNLIKELKEKIHN